MELDTKVCFCSILKSLQVEGKWKEEVPCKYSASYDKKEWCLFELNNPKETNKIISCPRILIKKSATKKIKEAMLF